MLESTRRVGVGGESKKGPNDTRCIIWALGVFFFLFFVFFITYQLVWHFFPYKIPSAHSSATTTPPSLKTRVRGVFLLPWSFNHDPHPPSLEVWDGGVFLAYHHPSLAWNARWRGLPCPPTTTTPLPCSKCELEGCFLPTNHHHPFLQVVLLRLWAGFVEILDGYSSAPPLHRRNPFRVFFIAFFSFYVLVPFRSFPLFFLLFTIHIK